MSQAPVGEGAIFLHQCLTHSDCKVDYHAVGTALSINAEAASKRMSRLKDRIKKQGTGMTNKSWSGNLDQDATFLFHCLMSSSCKVDYNKVGAALGISGAATAKRYSRLKAKYASAGNAAAAPAAIVPKPNQSKPAKSSNIPVPVNNKRKSEGKEQEGEEEQAQNKKAKKAAPVKQEDASDEEESDDEEGSVLDKTLMLPDGEKRATRGKTTNFKDLLEGSEDGTPRIPGTDVTSDVYHDDSSSEESLDDYSDGNWSEESGSEDEELKIPTVKKRSGLPTPVKTPKAAPRGAGFSGAVRKTSDKKTSKEKNNAVSPNTPVGLSGIQMLSGHRSARQVATRALPRPIKVSDTALCAAHDTANSAYQLVGRIEKSSSDEFGDMSEEGLENTTSENQRARSASIEMDWEDAVETMEDVLPSIEETTPMTKSSRFGFLGRVSLWWK